MFGTVPHVSIYWWLGVLKSLTVNLQVLLRGSRAPDAPRSRRVHGGVSEGCGAGAQTKRADMVDGSDGGEPMQALMWLL